MNRTLSWVGVLMAVVGFSASTRTAAADPVPQLRIVLQVPGPASVPLHIAIRAKAEVTRIYGAAGVDVVWSADSDGANRRELRQPRGAMPGLGLVVLPTQVTGTLLVATNALGGATGTPEERGRIAYVFYDRVEGIVKTYLRSSRRCTGCDMENVIMLGHVMAHEIGHLVLPYGHAPAGLMRANWDAANLRAAQRGELNFSAEEAALIRARLSGGAIDPPARLPAGASPAD